MTGTHVGFPDDLFGWDFRNHTPFARDEFGHGTHVAGTIGATGNNSIGVAGVNWAVSLMSLKFLGANNEGTLAEVREALLRDVDLEPNLTDKVAAGGRLNAFRTVTADSFAPRAAIVSMSDISAASSTPQRLTVRYWSNSPLDFTSIRDGDLEAVHTWGKGDTLTSKFVPGSATIISSVECSAAYDLAAPGGDWEAADYGDFEVRVVAGQVKNTTGLASPDHALGAFHVQPQNADVFYVNSFLDSVDANPGDGIAADAAGFATLRAAVMETNALTGAQTIVLQAGTYTLTIPGRPGLT